MIAGKPGFDRLRIAIVSTPRAGNTFLRMLLGDLYGLQQVTFHTPDEVPWPDLPERVILQLHWAPTPLYHALLRQYHFRIVTLARHPFDTLLSILHFASSDLQTACWLDGEGGDEKAILGCDPLSPAFEQYATGPRARSLLAVSQEWWTIKTVHRVRYEDLVRVPFLALNELIHHLDCRPVKKLRSVLEEHTLARMRAKTAGTRYVWRGQPDGWVDLLPAPLACRLATTLSDVFSTLGYDSHPNEGLTSEQAANNWRGLA